MAAEQDAGQEETIPFYPDMVRREAIVGLLVLVAAVLAGALLIPHLGPQADPMETPAHIKPEWYFLAFYQLVKLVPQAVGVLAPVLGGALLILLPFLDRTGGTDGRLRRWRAALVIVLGAAVVALTVWGYTS